MKTTALFAAILAPLALLGPAGAEIISYWSFDTDFSDATGAHDGTPQNGAVLTTGGLGFGGGEALSLNGGSGTAAQHVTTANPETLDFNSDFTWHAYIKTTSAAGGIFGRAPATPAIHNRGSKSLFLSDGGNARWDTGWVGAPSSNTSVNDGAWHQIIATYVAATDQLDVFVDPPVRATTGQLSTVHDVNRFDEHTDLDPGPARADSSFRIGQISDNFRDGAIVGLIDEAAVFDTALTGAELSQLIHSGPSSFVTIVPVPAIRLSITPAADGYDLEWDSQAGMLYRVRGNTGLGTPIDTWSIVDDDIAATPPSNTYNVDPGDPTLFYAVEEYPAPPPPPLLEENFDAAAALPAGWASNGPSNGTDWEVGTPSGVVSGPTAANSAPNCAGTNIGGYYTENADVSLISPSIAIPSGSGASLSFRQFIDTDITGTPHDLGSVRILDADNSDTPIAGLEILDIEGDGLAGWTEEMLDLPALDVGGKNIKVEFRFVSNAGTVPDADVWGGFYVDDVTVTAP